MLTWLANAWWNACTKPFTSTFRNAKAGRSHLRTLAGIVVAAVGGVALSWVIHRLLHDPQEQFMGLASIWVKGGTPAPVGSWLVVVPFGVIYGFYSFEIVLFIFARILGGKGSFGTQSYVQSLFYAPLAVIQQLVAVSPQVGRLVFAAVAAASLIPTTTSLKAAHDYSTGRAVLTWVIPIILNMLFIVGIVMLLSRSR